MKKFICIILSCLLFSLNSCVREQEVSPLPPEQRGAEFMPLTEIQEGRKNIYVLVKNINSNYWKVVEQGAKAAGEELNCNVWYSGTYSETDWEYQEVLLQTCIQNHADAILLAPDDSVMIAPKVSEIYQQHIPIILIDTIANTEDYNICYMTDNLIAGQNAAKEMLSLLERRGFKEKDSVHVGIMVGAVTSQTINERLAGFFQFWTQNAPENWEIITDIVSYEGNSELSFEYAEQLLKEHPEINAVYGTNNGPTVGLAKTLKELNRTDISIVGFDYSDEIAELVNSPEFNASTMLQRQFHMCYDGIQTALAIIDGEQKNVKFVDTGVVTVNQDTLNTPEVQKVILYN